MQLRVGRFRVALLALALVTGGLAACGPKSGGPQQGPGAMPVTVVTLKEEPVALTRELPGRTSPFLIAEVRPQVSGIVKKRLFKEGTWVKAGEPLYQLDDATYRADYGMAKAALARAEAAETAARLRAKRSAELVKTGLVSAQDNDNAVAALQQAEADVGSARAALTAAGVVVDHALIVAPIAGRIGKSSVTEGALVTKEQSAPLATIQQLDPVYVDVTQSSAELLQLRKDVAAGMTQEGASVPVTILLEDGTRYAHDGMLAFSDVTVDPSTDSYLLRVQVPNPEHTLLPGMYVRAVITGGVRAKGVLVPQQGITRDPRGSATAMVVDSSGKVQPRAVQVSRAIGDKWLVDSGLAAGDRVIVEGLQKIQPGMPVQATEAGTAPPVAAQPAPQAPGSDKK